MPPARGKAFMTDQTDRPAEPYWVARMRDAGYTARVGTDTSGLSYMPEVSFHDALIPREGFCPMTETKDTACTAEPYWVERMRADGWSVRVGTDPTPIPVEPEIWFSPPAEACYGRRRRGDRPLRGKQHLAPHEPVGCSTVGPFGDKAHKVIDNGRRILHRSGPRRLGRTNRLQEPPEMTDATSATRPKEPEWVQEMRDQGYIVRVGTGTRGLPYHPEISYHDCESPPARLRRRLVEFVRDLWNRVASSRQTSPHRSNHRRPKNEHRRRSP
jgi:hypothetical protein